MKALTSQELNMALAALRWMQETMEQSNPKELSDFFARLPHFTDEKPLSGEEIDTLCEKMYSLDKPALQTDITDLVDGLGDKVSASIEIGNIGGELLLSAKGYSDCNSEDNVGFPLLIENNAGNLQLRVWADINKEDPTHVISLQGAKNEMRQE
ncbi:hypothetical protein [Vibrio penaeicida]|uniref:hypothetical protein n=1 Tax=Vibrio penaeicida TaxID=104609 RepID=UPI001CC741A4|nr:hypothetical protein [Vibrio penaeicida]